ncbi:type VII secretion-associated serine protease mycosin [Streptomyces pactum]|uniref:Type VII secretion-associated serine protease mycosin n=1 Tax=Streptomyces pactum TaxID=68249 RepID=A0ABS0NQ05_9ACTN|nr:type VII secretion-associated serine protease mycosin [Streptomyces pactum]MBH5337289.1 type VII secretion-associated serine protease mycosin [Streptomyces pactum]
MRQTNRPAALTAALLLTACAAASGTGPTDDPPASGDAARGPAPAAPAGPALSGVGECTYPMKEQYKARPWALQRVVLDELWRDTRGENVRVAVIDTGVDDRNPQLRDAVDRAAGLDLLGKGKAKDPTHDEVGHGTKAAGIIAARPRKGTGFVGLAPRATIIPIRQNDEKGKGTTRTMATAIRHAINREADVINISQDTVKPLSADSDLARAVREAVERDIVVVASAGNDGLDGKRKNTYPAAYDGVLAVAASDRNDERAPFSQSGDFIDVAAPGVDMISTVPGYGHCADNGTSFSAPYVAGVAALLKARYPTWTAHQIVTQIQQTADRVIDGHDPYIGWGVVNPVRALQEDAGRPIDKVTPDRGPAAGVTAPRPAALTLGETPQERRARLATYAMGVTAVLVAVVAGTATVARDRRRRS